MLKKSILGQIALSFATLLPVVAHAEAKIFTIINHFNDRLYFNVNINQGGVPGFPQNFSLGVDDTISSEVLAMEHGHPYIRVFDESNDKRAFFGVELAHDKLIYHRYITHGIAYTFGTDSVTFCTMDEVKKNGHC